MILSMSFIRCEGSAIGLNWFNSLGCPVFGPGTTKEVFHGIGTLSRLRLRSELGWRGSFNSLELLPSRPDAFLAFIFIS